MFKQVVSMLEMGIVNNMYVYVNNKHSIDVKIEEL